MEIKLKVLSPVVLYLFVDLLAKGLQFLFLPSASHILNIEAYAKLTLILSLLTALAPIVSFSSESAYSVFFNQVNSTKRNKLFLACFLVALSGLSFFCGLAFILSFVNDQLIFKIISLRQDIILICVIVFFEFVITVCLLSNRLLFEKFKYFTSYLVYVVSKFSLGLFIIYNFGSTEAYLLGVLSTNIIFSILFVSRSFGIRKITKEMTCEIQFYFFKVLKYSTIILPVTLFSVINSLVDKAFISNYLTIYELANYTSAFLLAGALQIIILALNKSYMPNLLKLYSQEGYEALDKVKQDTFRFLLIVLVCFMVFTLLSPLLFYSLFDEKVQFNYQVYVILTMAFSFNTIYILYTNVLSLEASTAKFKMYGFLIALFFNIPLSYLLTKEFGLVGAASSTLLSTLIAASVLYFFVSKLISKFYLLKICIVFVFVISVLGVVATYLELYKFILN